MRSVWGTFPEYHTSADNLDFIRADKLAGSLRVCAAIVDVLENDRQYCNRNPYCEPQLGRRGLYRSTGGDSVSAEISARLWALNLSDGEHSLLDIAERSDMPFATVCDAADVLADHGLLSVVPSA
jgi:aminopeptidase-like protein